MEQLTHISILATELACQKLQDQGHKSELRNAVAGILKSAKLPHSNITKQETKAIKSLKQDNSITILPVDKGRTTVIMDTDTYKQQLTNMLQDRNISKILKKDSTEQKKRTLKTLLKPLLGTNKITQEAYNHLIPTANVTPQIYGTPKIHKKDTPLRPVVDSIGSVTYNLSKFVATSTYFQFKGITYSQKQGFAMGDPLSAIMSNFSWRT
uniref:H15 domain-containing protein n=1 Tax=Amphiprion ocellaris TaxID=80972 RepID=A0A3Q1CXI0_AMPOC